MSKLEKCIKCEHYESIYDGFGMCVKEALPVMVVDDYEPTKNYAYCEKKTAYQMQHEGWCDDCNCDVRMCIQQSQCEGYRRYDEKTN